jgi:hypothetical protein
MAAARSRTSPSVLSYSSFEDRSLQSPVNVCQYYNYNDIDRFEAALHAVDQCLKNEQLKLDMQDVDEILKIVYSFCAGAIDQIFSSFEHFLLDGDYQTDLIDETETLLLMVVENCWIIHSSRESAGVVSCADTKSKHSSQVSSHAAAFYFLVT